MLDLRKIIDQPGSSLPFEGELPLDGLDFPSVSGYNKAPYAKGRVYNEAGILHLEGTVSADMKCICDRCSKEFESEKITDVDVILALEDTDDNPDIYLIEGDGIDVDEVMATSFILDMETKFLCREDCRGICPKCGKNLNEGPCDCRKEVDPRFAVLEQLLDK